MTTLRNYLIHTGHKGEIGLEIETECKTAYNVLPGIGKYWGVHIDGSLRQNGIEYVFNQPYNLNSKQYNEAMAAFEEQAKAVKFLKSSYTSVHVHLNFLDRTLVSMMNFITLYYLFEEFLTEYCGNTRNGNLFCLKTSNAEGHYKTVVELAKSIADGSGSTYIKRLNNDYLKYAGLNIVPLRTFGSLEVRTHPGTVDVKEINRWVEILSMLYKKADTFTNPVEIISRLNGYKSKEAFFELIFEEYSKFFDLKNAEDKMKNGIWYACAVAKSVDNWKTFGEKKSVKNNRKAELEGYYAEVPIHDPQPPLRQPLRGTRPTNTTQWVIYDDVTPARGITNEQMTALDRAVRDAEARLRARPVTTNIEDI